MKKYTPEKIFILNDAKDYLITETVLKNLPSVPVEFIADPKEISHIIEHAPDPIGESKKYLLLTKNKGGFLKYCPGTAQPYICCGYRIANFYVNCNLDCTYCILQAYLNNPFIIVNVNIDDLADQIEEMVCGDKDRYFRIGTGELGDSLSLDHITEFTKHVNPLINKYDNLTIEYKTKSNNVGNLKKIDHRGKIVVSWSMNAEKIARSEDIGSATLDERLEAAAQCEKLGYKIGFHFDPIIHYDGWQEGYEKTIDKIFNTISDKNIAWVSLGCFRYMPDLKEIIEQRFADSKITHHEFILGLDKKMRYFKTLRIEMYSALYKHIRKYSDDAFVYLCMESPQVWQRAFGFSPKNMKELSDWLDRRC